MKNEIWDYKIDGKTNGLARIIISGVLFVVFFILTIDQLQPHPNKYFPVALGFAGISAAFFIFLAVLSVRYFCFKIFVGKSGFYFQTNFSNGKYYKYSDIKSCREELKVYRHNHHSGSHSNSTLNYYYFIFTEKSGKTTKFQFEKSIHEREIDVLKERIENANR